EREATLKYKNAEIESRLEKLSQEALKLGDGQVIPAFEEVLNSAKRQIIIYCPWLSQAFFNKEFLTLLQKLANTGVWILIGYGISPEQAEVEKKLRAIKTPHDLPSVQFLCLGNSPIKEVIVDQKVHFYGFFDWVNCGGEYLPNGESVYQVTIPQQVAEAYHFLAHGCQNHAETQWNIALEKRDFQLAAEALCVWGALNMQNIALQEIAESNWLELLPVWLNIVFHDLMSQKIIDDSINFTNALSLLSQLSGESAFIDELQQGWRKVIQAIASVQPEFALSLLNEQVWADFIRLKIAQEHDSRDNLILPQGKPLSKRRGKVEVLVRGNMD
ncbi:MAG: hypothetical protein NWQ28_00245, partial [Nodularia sp. (in: cyanobacteria)]|nr:hypothetical protein [Nodularia sp. (in: cyanobacteria)]